MPFSDHGHPATNTPPFPAVTLYRELHDLNNMLTVVFGYSELLLSGVLPGDPNRAMLEELRGAAVRAVELTRQMRRRPSPSGAAHAA